MSFFQAEDPVIIFFFLSHNNTDNWAIIGVRQFNTVKLVNTQEEYES